VGEKQRKNASEANIFVGSSIKDVVADADWIITALPKTEHVETVLT
jgi:3-hydroxyisobutyrate dehydrogenase-like beta-hydroxyacid dehydrogenase